MKFEIERYFDRLFPICRSITGQGLRDSFAILQELIPLELTEVPTGTKVLDWEVPREWSINSAHIEDSEGSKVVDFEDSNLHVLNYSIPVDQRLDLNELEKHLYSREDRPDCVPYVTSYYKERWGFCLSHKQRSQLKPGTYRAFIDSKLFDGSLTYGECLLPSTEGSTKEVLLTSYLCHPSLANNELSGPLCLSFLYRRLASKKYRKYNYRFLIAPETIGAISFLADKGEHLKQSCIAGYVLTCCGDAGPFTYKRSRRGNSLADRCALRVVEKYTKEVGKEFIVKDFFPTGSDERQFCSPGFNLPVGSLMRSMYGEYDQYHCSDDDKNFISFEAMGETVNLYEQIIDELENAKFYLNKAPYGEPQLGKRDLYPTLSQVKEGGLDSETFLVRMMYILNFSDGEYELAEIAKMLDCSEAELTPIVDKLKAQDLLKELT